MNISLFSYAGVLHFGLVATWDIVEPDMLSAYIEDHFKKVEIAIFESHLHN